MKTFTYELDTGSAHEVHAQPESLSRQADYLASVAAIEPAEHTVEDIQRNTLSEPVTGQSGTLIRDYKRRESRIATKALRAKAIRASMPYIYSPLIGEANQDAIADQHIKWLKGKATIADIDAAAAPVLAELAVTNVILQHQDTAPTPANIAAFATENPDFVGGLLLFAKAKFATARLHSDDSEDITRYPHPSYLQKPPMTIGGRVAAAVNMQPAVATYNYNPEAFDVMVKHMDAMRKLRDTGYVFSFDATQNYDYFRRKDNWPNNPGVKDTWSRPAHDEQFKFHLMPERQDIPGIIEELIACLRTNRAFAAAIPVFKVATAFEVGDRSEHAKPDVVIYSEHTVEAVATTLNGLRTLFANRKGVGITPRFNMSVDDSTLLYMSQGHGQDKLELLKDDSQALGQVFDASANHAFRLDSATMLQQIRIRANQIDDKK